MKPMKLINEANKPGIKLTDEISIKLAQTRALLLIGSDTDFSEYPDCVQHDFLGLILDCVEDMGGFIKELPEK